MVDQQGAKPLRKLKIDFQDFEMALQNHSFGGSSYFDLETGKVIHISDETRTLVERFNEELEDGPDPSAAFIQAVQNSDLHDWQKQDVLDANQVEEGFGTRYVQIQPRDSREGCEDMEDFIETIENARVFERLSAATRRPKPFRRFKDALEDYPKERERWFKFQAERIREWIIEWLREEGIEPIED